ncbi:Thioredoxin superfamily protein [Quillaja saponaria]|uniref:Thioredoxin superfamily protein n=1 Tax=Quillaja saponaria TaxID=32244 RepID=A0AAD7LGS6_QUISA|nr:Thioredoxin superfamily protein [Quillaja saponaria]
MYLYGCILLKLFTSGLSNYHKKDYFDDYINVVRFPRSLLELEWECGTGTFQRDYIFSSADCQHLYHSFEQVAFGTSHLEMERSKNATLLLLSTFFLVFFFHSFFKVRADYIPPAKLNGFPYGNLPLKWDTVLVEAFYDPLCPYSRDSWPPLKQALSYYGSSVSLVVHLLPLPYHDNAFVASRALHIVNDLYASATFPLLEWFFKHQEKFYGAPTSNLSRASIIDEVVKSATEVAGRSYYNEIKVGFNNLKTDLKTRVSFKYAASRGVYGTPSFYVNGFLLSDTGSTIDYNGWRKVLDPLVGTKS